MSECINNNILNLKNEADTSDEEFNQVDLNLPNEKNNPFKDKESSILNSSMNE